MTRWNKAVFVISVTSEILESIKRYLSVTVSQLAHVRKVQKHCSFGGREKEKPKKTKIQTFMTFDISGEG